jgi:cyclic pyranopterin phosphate synthase
MIDISEKKIVTRSAKAKGRIFLSESSVETIKNGSVKKGDVIECAKIAGTLAVKRIHEIIPYCHQVPIESIEFNFSILDKARAIECTCEVKALHKTGVEMEALLGVEIALITIWDMVKYMEKDENGQYPDTKIEKIKVVEKTKGD